MRYVYRFIVYGQSFLVVIHKMCCKGHCFPLKLIHPLGWFRKCFSETRSRKIVLMLVGLDNAGKSSIAKFLAQESLDSVVPTVGFNLFNLKHERGLCVTIYDLGGGSQIRGIWHRYYGDVHGAIFVIDASDTSRIEEVRRILHDLLCTEKLLGKPVLILANKQDIEGALDELDLVERLNLETLVNQLKCPTMVQSCSATEENLVENKKKDDSKIVTGYSWLLRKIMSEYDKLNTRVELDCVEQKAMMEAARAQCRNRNKNESLNGNPFKPIKTLLEQKNSPVKSEPDSCSNSATEGGDADILVINQPQPLDIVIAVKEQFENKVRRQKRHKLSLLPRSNRTAPTSADSDNVLPPLKGPFIGHCSWARPSTTRSLPARGWGLGMSLDEVYPHNDESDSSIVMLKSPTNVLPSSDSGQEDVVTTV